MKNIHALPTEHISRLRFNSTNRVWQLCEFPKYHTDIKSTHTICITSDEEIKDRDYYLYLKNNKVYQFIRRDHTKLLRLDIQKKIILTTDQDLIKDGVQAIDDEFLKWFVKNPNCERVEVEKYHGINTSIAEVNAISGDGSLNWEGKNDLRDYKIIIPKEEPKQETLEEFYLASIKNVLQFNNDAQAIRLMEKYFHIKEEEQDKNKYSEEDLAEAFEAGKKLGEDNACLSENYRREDFKEWFEQFKKK